MSRTVEAFICPVPECNSQFSSTSEVLAHLNSGVCTASILKPQVRTHERQHASSHADNVWGEPYNDTEPDEDDISDDARASLETGGLPSASTSVAAESTSGDAHAAARAYLRAHAGAASRDDGSATDFTRPPDTSRHLHSNSCWAWPSEFGKGNLYQRMERDSLAEIRRTTGNIYYPFRNEEEFELVDWMESSKLSDIDKRKFLELQAIKRLQLSIKSPRDLLNRVEHLPKPPQWFCQQFAFPEAKTEQPMLVYYMDSIDTIDHLVSNPVFTHALQTTAYRDLRTSDSAPIIGEFMSSEYANLLQGAVDEGECVLGIIGSTDKAPLTMGTGNKSMYPLLYGVANMHGAALHKAKNDAFIIGAYLPVPKFKNVSPAVQSMLQARAFHHAVKIATASFRKAARHAVPLTFGDGLVRLCRTPLVDWIADTPEQAMIALTGGRQSPITTARIAEFGDSEQHPLRTRAVIVDLVQKAKAEADPDDFEKFLKVCQRLCINGVVDPFWLDWSLNDEFQSCPSIFIAPGVLHQAHKFFWDHLVKWAQHIIGEEEFDRRLASLPLIRGKRRWLNGISGLKQVTGREYRELEGVFLAVIHGAVSDGMYKAFAGLVDLIFDAQQKFFSPEAIAAMQAHLTAFHDNKHHILEAGARRGKKKTLDHWQIQKLELLLNFPRSIPLIGAIYRSSADPTERLHQTGKELWRQSNGALSFLDQIVRALDRERKLRDFGMCIRLKKLNVSPPFNHHTHQLSSRAKQMIIDGHLEDAWMHDIFASRGDGRYDPRTLFDTSLVISVGPPEQRDASSIALHLTTKPHHRNVDIYSVPNLWGLPDFVALLHRHTGYGPLPYNSINAWNIFAIQRHVYGNSEAVLPRESVYGQPRSRAWPFGLGGTVLIAAPTDYTACRLTSEPMHERYLVAHVRCIFTLGQNILPGMSVPEYLKGPLLYVRLFEFTSEDYWPVAWDAPPLAPHSSSKMHMLRKKVDERGLWESRIISLSDVCRSVELVPAFGQRIDRSVTAANVYELASFFHLNSYADKDTRHATFVH